MKKEIAWEKFVDPLGSNIEEVNYPGFYDDDDDEDDYLAQEQQQMFSPLMPHPHGFHSIKPHKIMKTPFGFITIDHHSLACDKFDFWIMHTNFDLNEKIVDAISKVPGVETFEVYTRYRARVGFPKSPLFDTVETKMRIKQIVIETEDPAVMTPIDVVVSDLDMETFAKVKMARQNLEGKSEHWALLVLPNGTINIITSDINNEDYLEKVEKLVVAQQLVGGEFYSSAQQPGV